MPRYAIVKTFAKWDEILTSGNIETFNEEDVIALDSMRITKKERAFLKKTQLLVYCPVCQEEVYFKTGYRKKNGELINPHWCHKRNSKDNCHHAEGAAHAMTKRFVFNKLRERGYKVKEERVHKIGGRYVRADVAALKESEKQDILKLVVEVQASSLRVADAQRRIAAYYREKAPVAWVLLLDSFFEQYVIMRGEDAVYNSLGEIEEERLIPDKEYAFYLAGKDRPAFNFLMDHYFYTIGVRYDGRVFLIRRSPNAAKRREEALSKGKKWTSQDDEYLISLIHDDRIADVLLQTPLIAMEYVSQEKKRTVEQVADEFKGGDCVDSQMRTNAKDQFIDFESGRTTEATLNSLQLIRETMEAAKQERIRLEKLRIKQESTQEPKKQGQEYEQIEFELDYDEESWEREWEKEREEWERLVAEQLWYDYLENEEEKQLKRLQEAQRNRFMEQMQQDTKQRKHEPVQSQSDQDTETPQVEVYYEPIDVSGEIKMQMRQDLWQKYLQVPKENREQWQKQTFQGDLPSWFVMKVFHLNRQEQKQKK